MDTSLTIKPRDAVSRSKSTRASIVRTEVAPAETVTPVKATDPNHNPAAAQDALGRDLVDPQGREVIYQARDERERERDRKRRHPDEALMRQRAYGRAAYPQEQHEQDSGGETHADFEI